MSEWGSIIDAIETEVRAALSDLPAGEVGFERAVRSGADLSDSQIPHVFAHDPTEQVGELDFQQLQVAFSVQLDLWTRNETQEQVNVRLDGIGSRIKANPTLGGLVDFAFVSSRSTVEAAFLGRPERAAVLIIQTRKDT